MLRRRLARLLDASGIAGLLLRVRSGWVPMLNYHRIHPEPEAQPFDRGVIDATPAELDRHMAILTRYFTPIGVDQLADHVTHGKPLPERPALVTFDDGYRECLTRALPILQARGVRASFFVPTALVSERRAFWWDRLSYLVRTSQAQRLEIHYPSSMTIDLHAGSESAVRRLLVAFKQTWDIDVERFVEEVGRAAGVAWDRALEQRVADELVLDWGAVRQLAAAGMEIHSHTRTHRILLNLPEAELDSELVGSRCDIRDAVGRAPRAISYPVGRPIGERPGLVERVQRAGYELGFSTGVAGSRARVQPFDIGRVCLDIGTDAAEFRAMLVHPALLAA